MKEIPALGEIRLGREIGKKNDPGTRYIYLACPNCQKERWIGMRKGKPWAELCRSCAMKKRFQEQAHPMFGTRRSEETKLKISMHSGRRNKLSDELREEYRQRIRGEKNPNWKGCVLINAGGYRQIKIYPENPFFPTAMKNGYILEHRYVMAQNLQRNLYPWEIIHHKNGIKTDNRIKNLELFDDPLKHEPSQQVKLKLLKQDRDIMELKNIIQSLTLLFFFREAT